MSLSCFKAYDIRGKLGDELNEEIGYCIGRAYAHHLKPRKGVISADVRLTSEALKLSFANGAEIDRTDGISLELPDFRFNLRASNTEPLLRLNVETRQNVQAVGLQVRQSEKLLCE